MELMITIEWRFNRIRTNNLSSLPPGTTKPYVQHIDNWKMEKYKLSLLNYGYICRKLTLKKIKKNNCFDIIR